MEESEADLARFEAWVSKIAARDYFAAPIGTEVRAELERARIAMKAFEAAALAEDTNPDTNSSTGRGPVRCPPSKEKDAAREHLVVHSPRRGRRAAALAARGLLAATIVGTALVGAWTGITTLGSGEAGLVCVAVLALYLFAVRAGWALIGTVAVLGVFLALQAPQAAVGVVLAERGRVQSVVVTSVEGAQETVTGRGRYFCSVADHDGIPLQVRIWRGCGRTTRPGDAIAVVYDPKGQLPQTLRGPGDLPPGQTCAVATPVIGAVTRRGPSEAVPTGTSARSRETPKPHRSAPARLRREIGCARTSGSRERCRSACPSSRPAARRHAAVRNTLPMSSRTSPISQPITIRRAVARDAKRLTRLVRGSGAYKGKYAAAVAGYRVGPDYIEAHRAFVAVGADEHGGRVLGFYSLVLAPPELDLLFVADEAQGRGIGRLLVAHMQSEARAAGLDRVKVVSHLPTEDFYHRVGAVRIGTALANPPAVPWDRPEFEFRIPSE